MGAAAGNLKRVAWNSGARIPSSSPTPTSTSPSTTRSTRCFSRRPNLFGGRKLLVESPIHDAFVETLSARMKAINVGNGAIDTRMGPLISAAHRQGRTTWCWPW